MATIASNTKKIQNSKNLRDLLNNLRDAYDGAGFEDKILEDLPVFGGERPVAMIPVWSWDETHVLVGDRIGDGNFLGDFEIVPRSELDD